MESYIIKQFKEQVVEVEASPENKIDNELEQKSPEKIDEDKIEEEPIEQVDQKEEECVVEKVDAEVEAPKIPKIAIEESDKEESKSFVLIFNDLMDLKIEAGGVMRSIKREKMKVDENLSKSLESSYEFYSAFKKEIDEHLANKVFDLTSYKIFKVTEFEKLYKGCVDISKEIDDWGEQLKKKKKESVKASQGKISHKEKSKKDKSKNGKSSKQEKVINSGKKSSGTAKPQLSNGKLGSNYRSWYLKQLDKHLSENIAFGLNKENKAKEVARNIEKEIYRAVGNLPAEYESSIDNIIEILKEVKQYPYLSKEIKRRKFTINN